MLRESYNWFSCSAKRRLEYRTLFDLINEDGKFKNLVQAAPTRWLPRYNSLNRILEQYLERKTHFGIVQLKEKCYTARMLKEMYEDDTNYLYFIFLRPILKDLNGLNMIFQSDNLDVFKAYEDMKLFLDVNIKKIIKPSFIAKDKSLNNLNKYLEFLQETLNNELAYLPICSADYGVVFERQIHETDL